MAMVAPAGVLTMKAAWPHQVTSVLAGLDWARRAARARAAMDIGRRHPQRRPHGPQAVASRPGASRSLPLVVRIALWAGLGRVEAVSGTGSVEKLFGASGPEQRLDFADHPIVLLPEQSIHALHREATRS